MNRWIKPLSVLLAAATLSATAIAQAPGLQGHSLAVQPIRRPVWRHIGPMAPDRAELLPAR